MAQEKIGIYVWEKDSWIVALEKMEKLWQGCTYGVILWKGPGGPMEDWESFKNRFDALKKIGTIIIFYNLLDGLKDGPWELALHCHARVWSSRRGFVGYRPWSFSPYLDRVWKSRPWVSVEKALEWQWVLGIASSWENLQSWLLREGPRHFSSHAPWSWPSFGAEEIPLEFWAASSSHDKEGEGALTTFSPLQVMPYEVYWNEKNEKDSSPFFCWLEKVLKRRKVFFLSSQRLPFLASLPADNLFWSRESPCFGPVPIWHWDGSTFKIFWNEVSYSGRAYVAFQELWWEPEKDQSSHISLSPFFEELGLAARPSFTKNQRSFFAEKFSSYVSCLGLSFSFVLKALTQKGWDLSWLSLPQLEKEKLEKSGSGTGVPWKVREDMLFLVYKMWLLEGSQQALTLALGAPSVYWPSFDLWPDIFGKHRLKKACNYWDFF